MREVLPYRRYIGCSHTELYGSLADVCTELSQLETEIALCEADKITAQVDCYQNSEQSSATARNQEAEIYTGVLRRTLVELYCDKATLMEEKHFIIRLLDA